MEILKPYRDRIDAIDDQIIDLLAARLDIIREVGALKSDKNIPPVLQDRVDEVINRNAARAESQNVDVALVRDFYTRLVRFCCDLEAKIIGGKS